MERKPIYNYNFTIAWRHLKIIILFYMFGAAISNMCNIVRVEQNMPNTLRLIKLFSFRIQRFYFNFNQLGSVTINETSVRESH